MKNLPNPWLSSPSAGQTGGGDAQAPAVSSIACDMPACFAEVEAMAAAERRWATWKWTSRGGRKVEMWALPERAAEIEAGLAMGELESRRLFADGGIYHQWREASREAA